MTYSVYQVDAFTTSIFKGNPACVVPLDKWLEDEILLNIAKENAVPETAFFVQDKDTIHLRWFTPDLEICLLYTSPSPRDISGSRMPSSA